MSTITIRDIGPIKELDIPLADQGGITVLVGPNDSGKSIGILSTSIACGGKGTVTKRDGALRGQLDVAGVTMNVTSRVRTIGDLDIESIEGKFDISDLIEPPVKDPAAADARRAKALLGIRGVGPDLDRFSHLLEDVPHDPKWNKATDLVDLATAVKTTLQARARTLEDAATSARAKAAACRDAVTGVDLEAETDETVLQDALTEATVEIARLEQQREEAKAAELRAQEAQKTLATATEENSGPSVEEAEAQLLDAKGVVETRSKEVQAAKESLEKARQTLNLAEQKLELAVGSHINARDRHDAAVERERLIASTKEIIQLAADTEPPTVDEEKEAAERARVAREAIEKAVEVRKAIEKKEEAKTLLKESIEVAAKAETVRDNAHAVDEVLTEAVQSQHLRATSDEKGKTRWVTDHPDRGETYYHERSRGTRCAIAVDEALAAMDPPERPSLILLRQDLWEGLDYDNRMLLHEHCLKRRANILTAEASRIPADQDKVHHGRLHAVMFGGDPAATGGEAAVEEAAGRDGRT